MADLRIGVALYKARNKQGLSRATVSRRAGLERSHLGKIERGVTQPSVANFVRLADAIGISAVKILKFACRLKDIEEGVTHAS